MHINPCESEVFKFPSVDRVNTLRVQIGELRKELEELYRQIGYKMRQLNDCETEFKHLLDTL